MLIFLVFGWIWLPRICFSSLVIIQPRNDSVASILIDNEKTATLRIWKEAACWWRYHWSSSETFFSISWRWFWAMFTLYSKSFTHSSEVCLVFTSHMFYKISVLTETYLTDPGKSSRENGRWIISPTIIGIFRHLKLP